MTDWRERLTRIVKRSERHGERPQGPPEAWRKELADFFENTVLPAFYELQSELERHGRQVEVDKGANHAVITVYHEGSEEFSYAVRGHAYHKMSFAFPAFDATGEEPKVAYASVVQPGNAHEEHPVKHFTKERVIEDFLDDYARWRGW